MLKHLRIQNLILIEDAALSFRRGLNVLTGETGSGKSAIMHALSLVVGERSDTTLIRRGCDKCTIEAVFENENESLAHFLTEGGIDYQPGEELIIRREISLSGKGRIFINHQTAQLSFLRKLGTQMVQIVAQHANQTLFSLDYHRDVIDLFGDLRPLLHAFQQSFDYEMKIKLNLEQLALQETQRVREISNYEKELEELENAQLKEGEEEELFAEYTLLANSEEVSKKISEINRNMSEDRNPLLPQLNRQKQSLESLLRFDPALKETVQAFQNVFLELQEIAYTLQRYQSSLSFDPQRFHFINERLALFTQLKRKYGPSLKEILCYQADIDEKLKKLINADLEIEELQCQLQAAAEKTQQHAKELSMKRQAFALLFEKAITKQLQSLNMPNAQFTVELTLQSRTREGDERIEFFLLPNIGEHRISLKEGASGGEMSRVLLAIQTLIAGKEQRAILIFDEVDANIGGETATIVGDKLHEISQQHQVICITHFPQVAMHADHHFQISKEEKEGRTISIVQELDTASRPSELLRMGGQRPLLTTRS